MLNLPAGNLLRRRLFGLVAVCALGVSLTGCVAYDDGGYGGGGYSGGGYAGGGYAGGGYAGGGYGGGYYGGGGSVNVYAPAYYRTGNRGHGGYYHNPPHNGGGNHGNWNGGGYHGGGGRPEGHNRRPDRGPDRRQFYGG